MDKNYNLWREAKKKIIGGNGLFSKRPENFLPNYWPPYFKKAKGCFIWDLNNKKYIDMSLMGVGTNVLGYANDEVDNAVIKNLKKSNMSTLNCPEEVILAKNLIKLHPWSSKVKFARTGGEANSVAVRIARAFTNKSKIAVCGYHGWHDWYLSALLNKKNKLGNFLLKGLNNSGIPKELKNLTHTFLYNDIKQLEYLLKVKRIKIIKIEVIRNVEPKNNFLIKVRRLANKYKAVLIFDECTTGFRETLGGIHKKYKVNPDMAIFGKALGNGYAITAVLGKKKIMDVAESSFISSTFWTERSGFTAAIKTIEIMKKTNSKKLIIKKGKKIKKIWNKLSKKHNVNIKITGIDSICNFIFDYKDSNYLKSLLTYQMLRYGFLSNNTVMISISHSDKIIDQYEKALDKSFEYISKVINKKIKFTKKIKLAYKGFYRLN